MCQPRVSLTRSPSPPPPPVLACLYICLLQRCVCTTHEILLDLGLTHWHTDTQAHWHTSFTDVSPFTQLTTNQSPHCPHTTSCLSVLLCAKEEGCIKLIVYLYHNSCIIIQIQYHPISRPPEKYLINYHLNLIWIVCLQKQHHISYTGLGYALSVRPHK